MLTIGGRGVMWAVQDPPVEFKYYSAAHIMTEIYKGIRLEPIVSGSCPSPPAAGASSVSRAPCQQKVAPFSCDALRVEGFELRAEYFGSPTSRSASLKVALAAARQRRWLLSVTLHGWTAGDWIAG